MVDSNYFIRGYAIHGYAEVPTYAASHGCLRVPIPDAAGDLLLGADRHAGGRVQRGRRRQRAGARQRRPVTALPRSAAVLRPGRCSIRARKPRPKP